MTSSFILTAILFSLLPVLPALEYNDEQCINGRIFMLSKENGVEISTDTNVCCDGYQMIDDICYIIPRKPFLEADIAHRFLIAMVLLLVVCCVVGLLSMLIAYTMFYRHVSQKEISERINLADDVDDIPSKV
ncbi:unnamed protein product [Caenorhabditis auriculariae]|uniref:Uncharacterized protein n=1 Tax=Caenorhabditis auriculariae TaxID=2777116 RepID=A0A8S1GRW4_9PELO|nr:unnamed protein product [Caenorhabditis auriculariae]